MGFLTGPSKTGRGDLKRLPTGTFTVDADGRVVSSTVPGSVPASLVKDIGRQVLSIFQEARRLNLQFSELTVHYAAFKITAREMRGGAIIFLAPRTWQSVAAP